MSNTMKQQFLGILACAGTASGLARAQDPVMLEPTRGQVVRAGHIYYNVASGERVVTLLGDGQTSGADSGASLPVWASQNPTPCASEGYTTELFFAVDNPGSTTLASRITLLDYGDIHSDTVVDCIQINWVVAHADAWANGTDSSSGVVGVEELAAQWMVWDADNGREVNRSTRLPLMDFLFFNLPGNTPDNQGAGALTGWTADVDLFAFGSATDLSFEIGDTDGDCQTAAFCNSDVDGAGTPVGLADRDFDGLADSDLDGDGLFDWSWTVRFYQPAMGHDFDSDSDFGDVPGTASDTIGIGIGVPEGVAVENGDGTWTWQIDEFVADAGTGEEDRFAIYNPPNSTGEITYNGGYWFGGFACTGGLISTGGTGYTPAAMFQLLLYSPGFVDCCPSDYNCDGSLDFFDVSAFIVDFNAMRPDADFNLDGAWDFFDVSLFIQDFTVGCP